MKCAIALSEKGVLYFDPSMHHFCFSENNWLPFLIIMQQQFPSNQLMVVSWISQKAKESEIVKIRIVFETDWNDDISYQTVAFLMFSWESEKFSLEYQNISISDEIFKFFQMKSSENQPK